MTILPILILGDPFLRKKIDKVEKIDQQTLDELESMIQTMRKANGIGLAASQVGINKRMLVLELPSDIEDPNSKKCIYKIINPILNKFSANKTIYEEGCLSIPNYSEEVERPEFVSCSYQNEKGEECSLDCTGLFATAIQHEVDHLEGKMYIDYISALKRGVINRKFQKMRRQMGGNIVRIGSEILLESELEG